MNRTETERESSLQVVEDASDGQHHETPASIRVYLCRFVGKPSYSWNRVSIGLSRKACPTASGRVLWALGLVMFAAQMASAASLTVFGRMILPPSGDDLRLVRRLEGAGGTHEGRLVESPEQPKPRYQIVTRLNPLGGATDFHLPRSYPFQPTDGLWRGIDFFVRGKLTTSPVGRRASVAPAIGQAGRVFAAPFQRFSAGLTRNYAFTNLTVRDFCEFTNQGRDTNAHPDFSTNGSPIEIGFALRHPAVASSSTEMVEIDYLMWVQRVTPAWTADFADHVFRAEDWEWHTIPPRPGGLVRGGRVLNGGEWGASLSWTNHLPGATNGSARWHLLRCRQASFVPSRQGGLGAVEGAFDGKTSEVEYNGTLIARFMVSQRSENFVVNQPLSFHQVREWESFRWNDCRAEDFALLRDGAIDPSVHPDFSTHGAPIQFGLALEAIGRSVASVDNWSVHLRRADGGDR